MIKENEVKERLARLRQLCEHMEDCLRKRKECDEIGLPEYDEASVASSNTFRRLYRIYKQECGKLPVGVAPPRISNETLQSPTIQLWIDNID